RRHTRSDRDWSSDVCSSDLDHCALNVALYGARARRWSMTERGRGAIVRDAESFKIGPSRLAWTGRELTIEINEVTVPWPLPLRRSEERRVGKEWRYGVGTYD